MKTTKRILAFILAIAMTLSIGTVNANAVSSDDLSTSNFSLVFNESNGTLTVSLNCDKNVTGFASASGKMSVTNANGEPASAYYILSGITAGVLKDMTPTPNLAAWGASASSDNAATGDTMAAGTWVTYTYTVSEDVPDGAYTFTMTFGNDCMDASFEDYSCGQSNVVGTYTVGDSGNDTLTSDYEIYYTLNNDADTLTENYKDYQYNTTEGATNQVKAEIFLKSKDAVTVQAYDIYLSHNSKLTYAGTESMDGVVYKTVENADSVDKVQAKVGDQVSHIQLVKDSGKTISLTAGTAKSLGTIIFDIASTAIYNEDLEIELKVAADTENIAKTADVTNISLATSDGGQVASYYPMNTGTDLGAEVVTTYTVTYNADNGTHATTQAVGRNQTANQPTDPEKAGYEFVGWYYTVDGQEKAFDFTTLITKNIELTAKWTESTAKYTIKHIQEKLDGTYEVKETKESSGKTGAQTAAVAENYEGFTAQAVTQKEIAADGSTVVEIYYDRNSYELTWNDGTSEKKSEVKFGATIEVPGAPNKEGYDFAGWDLDSDNAVDEIPATMPSNGLTANAIWTPITYTVTYNGNDNTGGSMTESTFTYDAENQKLTANTFTKTGYTFTGWNTMANGSGTPYTDENDVMNWANTQNTNIELFAQWKPNTYTVVFDGNGATSGNMDDQEFTYDAAQKLTKNAFEKKDDNYTYTFAGWKNNADGKTYSDEQEVKNLATNGTVTLTAQWTTNYVVSTYATAGQGTVTAQPNTAAAGQTITITVKTEDGYQIDKVTYTEEDKTEAIDITMNGITGTFTMPAANVSVTATFTAIPYDVTVTNPTDGTGTITETGTTEGKATVGQEITLSNVPADGYELDAYIVKNTSTNTDVTVVDGKFIMPASAVTVTATFKVTEYTITYELNGGTLATDVQNPTTYTVNTETFTLNNPTREGYTFVGWTGSNGTTPETTVTIEKGSFGEKTYTANWTGAEVEYTVYHWQQEIGKQATDYDTGYTKKDTETLKGTTDSEVTPARKAYEGFTAPDGQEVTIAADGSTVVNYYYTRNSYTITATANNASYGTVTGPATAEYGSTVILSNTPATGYEFGSYSGTYKVTEDGQEVTKTVDVADNGTFTMPAADVTVVATFKATQYEITFDLNGGDAYTGVTITGNKMSYTIESTNALPGASRNLYTLTGWKVTTKDGNWTDTSLIDAGTPLNRNFGNVTLTAQWTFMEHEIQDYKYAYNPSATDLTDGYMMLFVKDGFGDETSKTYMFDGKPMYWTNDENYLLDENDTGVFYTLIKETYVANGELNADGEAKLSTETSGRTTLPSELAQKCDINGDSVVNIADANVVYQMTLSGGSYYSDGEVEGGQLDSKHRLMADLHTAIVEDENGISLHRGSIADVHIIVNYINGVTPTT